jgi:hypothetical protein
MGTVNLPFIDFIAHRHSFQQFFFNTGVGNIFSETVLRQRNIDILNRRQILDIGGCAECVPAVRKVSLLLKSASLIN